MDVSKFNMALKGASAFEFLMFALLFRDSENKLLSEFHPMVTKSNSNSQFRRLFMVLPMFLGLIRYEASNNPTKSYLRMALVAHIVELIYFWIEALSGPEIPSKS